MHMRLPWFPFFVSDWMLDPVVQSMSLATQGAYLKLLCIAWWSDGIPADHDTIRTLIGAGGDEALTPALLSCWEPHPDRPGFLHNRRLSTLATDQAEKHAKRREAGKRGRQAQLEQSPGNAPPIAGQSPGSARALEQNRTEQSRTEKKASLRALTKTVPPEHHPEIKTFLDALPATQSRERWGGVVLGCLQGLDLPGGQPAPLDAVLAACRDFPALVGSANWSPRHFRACVAKARHVDNSPDDAFARIAKKLAAEAS